MEEKTKGKSIYIVIVVVVIAAIAIGAYFLIKNNTKIESAKAPDKIVVKESDSDEDKIAKLQKKIELLNERIEKVQKELNPELEKLNDLYEAYVMAMTVQQQGDPNMQPDIDEEEISPDETEGESETEEEIEIVNNEE